MSNNQSANLLTVGPIVSDTRASISDSSFIDNSFIDNNSDDNDKIDIESFKEEQGKNDKILNFLLNYKCPKKRLTRNNKSNANSLSQPAAIPDTVKDQLKSISDISDLHGGVLLDYLMKVSQLNKRLIVSLDALYQKYTYISSKIVESNTTLNLNSNATEIDSVPINVPVNVDASVGIVNTPIITESIELKLDQLEQKNNINILLCNGDFIDNLKYNDNIELKSKIVNKIQTVHSSLCDSDIETVVSFNKNSNSKDKIIRRVKVFCRSTEVKKSILFGAREKKLNDIYFSEFLTVRRFKLFFELRQLRREFPSKIFAVYTRNGNLFCKLSANEHHIPIKIHKDIEHLRTQLSGFDDE